MILLVFNFECCRVSGDDDLDHLFRSMKFLRKKLIYKSHPYFLCLVGKNPRIQVAASNRGFTVNAIRTYLRLVMNEARLTLVYGCVKRGRLEDHRAVPVKHAGVRHLVVVLGNGDGAHVLRGDVVQAQHYKQWRQALSMQASAVASR